MKAILLALLVSMPSAFAAGTPALRCGGTEPFWSVQVNNGVVTYSSYEVRATYGAAKVTDAVGMSEGTAFQVTAQGSPSITLSVIKSECGDGMSDASFPYKVLANVGGTVLYGCCR